MSAPQSRCRVVESSLLHTTTMRRTRYRMESEGPTPLAVVVATVLAISAGTLHPGDRRDPFVRDADSLQYRVVEARLTGGNEYRPFRGVTSRPRPDLLPLNASVAGLLRDWEAGHDRSA